MSKSKIKTLHRFKLYGRSQIGPGPRPGPKPGPKSGPSWAQAGPKLGPSRAQARPKLGAQKIKKKKILKIKIHVAQNVGKVWIGRKKNHPGPIGGHLGPFFAWAGKIQKIWIFCKFSLVGPCCDPPLVGLLVGAHYSDSSVSLCLSLQHPQPLPAQHVLHASGEAVEC